MSTESLDVSIAAALNGLPTVSPDTVTVSRSDISGGGYRYTVTFNSGMSTDRIVLIILR